MANLIEEAKTRIDALLRDACRRAAAEGLFPEDAELRGTVEIPKDARNGDYAANHAMAGAKAMKMPPRKIAEILTQHLELEGSWFDSAEIAGPGFLNFRVSDKWYAAVLAAVEAEGPAYGRAAARTGEKVMVEFVSANPTGPMTIGNARGGVLGDTLATVLDMAGADVYREFYVNDAGNQVDKFGRSIDERYRELLSGDGDVQANLQRILDNAELPAFLKLNIPEQVLQMRESGASAVASAAQLIARRLAGWILFLLGLILASLLLRLLFNGVIAPLIDHIPLVNETNRALGGILGAVLGILLAGLLLFLCYKLLPVLSERSGRLFAPDSVEGSILMKQYFRLLPGVFRR